ncbi:MAG: riboflavin biosynthesis protein RibF [Lachnospiraceae bacterium]|uniref:riboflavin biosynthesis protein RibF n=1 Tax=uncultured Acetatifactor sp. TaxID=1671927 RepID=UPI00262F9CDE|nr:riboflavin biosynthesis protein RibF [uncultured Acetatifactor sp.]MCI8788569.1 riboflavin biosynthesis protein RibF [Lachnospiraceae bacterium]
MEIIAGTTQIQLGRETAAAIGKFDGVHIGHRRLLEEILSRKKDGLAACVFTFDPPPAVFFGCPDGKELTTKEEKRLLFQRMGVDVLIEFPLNDRTAATPPEEFAREILAGQMQVRFLAAGTDLSFGAKGAGDAALLRKLGPGLGFAVETIGKVCLEGREVSSTLVRAQVESGDMESAERLLGMPYLVAGQVVPGKQLGRTLGFPTVNILPRDEKLLPPKGVYLSRVRHKDKVYRAISNVGNKPTVTRESVIGVESYLYDFAGDLYGEQIEVYLCAFRRPERRFQSVEALREQLKEDIAAGKIL